MANEKALVLFSGGQDSTVCLAWALERFASVETVGFDYGQRHRVELDVRPRIIGELRARFPSWGERLGADHLLHLPVLGEISDTALTRDLPIEAEEGALPNTFVPGRNLLFVTLAAALAYRRGATRLVAGVCETDYSGYPDCREATMRALEKALNLGMETDLVIEAPLMHLDKAETWALAEDLGGDALVEIVRDETHSCYEGDRSPTHEWGRGCGECPACRLRAQGYSAWKAVR